MQLAPSPEMEFVVGTVGIAYDSRNDRMVVQIEELIHTDDNEEPIEPFTSETDAARLRVQITRGQAAAFC